MAGGIPWRYIRGATWRGGDSPVTPRSELALLDIPAAGTPPQQVHDWWQYKVNDVQVDYAISTYPRQMGDLDGLPVTVRDRANAHNLTNDKTQLTTTSSQVQAKINHIQEMIDQARLNELYPDAPDSHEARLQADAEIVELMAQKELSQERLDAITVVEERLGNTNPRAYLIKFSVTQGKGRVILSVNNPDTTNNVISSVPGTFAGLDEDLRKDIDRADVMVQDSRAMASTQTTAAVMWLGYDAPQLILPEAARDQYADDAAPDLRRFQQGLRVTHQGGAGHLVLLGHSYGTTVVGHTARDSVAADDVILVASPGVGVDAANELHLAASGAAGRVWATTAKCDVIAQAADIWRLGPSAADFVFEGSDIWKSLVNGTNPVHPDFGARVFRSDTGNCLNAVSTHSAYWNEGNQARTGIAGIVTGNSPAVVQY
jgi:hypothetical protein